MKWGKVETILAIIVSLIFIGGAIYKFDICKVEKEAFATYQAKTDVQFLEIQRRNLRQRMYDLERLYPNDYNSRREYQELKQKLELLDKKIEALYRKGS